MIKPLLIYFGIETEEYTKRIFDELDKIECDQYRILDYKYPKPHQKVEELFRENKQYTHLVVVPNDMVPTREAFEILKKDIEENDYGVISGLINVDRKKYRSHYNICIDLPSIKYNTRRYNWIADSTINHLIQNNKPIIQVKFSGFPMTWIRRDVFEKNPITWIPEVLKKGAPSMWEKNLGYANDLGFCTNLDSNGEPHYVDLRCKMFHYGIKPLQKKGGLNPRVMFIKNQVN